jgi:murein DD-endopeptidase MepM/ murein hydrolase activator NlpD
MILASAALLAGCSADITRFDLGNSESARAHSENSYGTTGRTASNEYGSAASYDASRGSDVSRSDLPPPQGSLTTSAISPDQRPGYGQPSRQPAYDQRSSGAPPYNGSASRAPSYGSGGYGNSQNGASGYQNAPAASYQNAPASGHSNAPASGRVPPLASHDAGAKGDMIEVRPGDTLYALSRRHKVSLNELMSLNGLSSPSLKPGQKLYLPAGTAGGTAVGAASQTARPDREIDETQHAAAAPSREAVDAPSDWTTSYTVRQGDSLYAIARQNGVKLADLERYNGISDSRKVKPGTVLRLPGQGGAAPVADASPAANAAPSASGSAPTPTPGAVQLGEVTNSPPQTSSSQQPTLLNGTGGERVAKAETPGSANDAVSPTKAQNSGSVADTGRLRWPVAGKVISSFGPRPDGTHNDGVNLAAPMGTDVHAAETGVVAYAGDELKGYGNLVLVRHDNGWVTAYAHADEILVKRGDRIKRGQVIAKAGRTGQVDQPQVHFELRQGQKPVDPTPFMERL